MENIKSINIDYPIYKFQKNIVNYVVLIFGIVVILIFLLIIIYYITPNNYEIVELEDNKFKFVSQIDYTLKPDSTTKIDIIDENSKYIGFTENINIIIKNSFKSQNILIGMDNKLIKIKFDSEIFLVNNTNLDKNVGIKFYSLNL
jgi:hypothetical protein